MDPQASRSANESCSSTTAGPSCACTKPQMDREYEVFLAGTYEEAMALLTSHQPDLIILDMVMPQVDGLEFLDILKNTHSFMRIPVIMVSGENDPNILRQAFLKGASDFVRKPYDGEELHLRVRRLLAQPTRVPNPREAEVKQFVSARSLMIKALSDLAGTRGQRDRIPPEPHREIHRHSGAGRGPRKGVPHADERQHARIHRRDQCAPRHRQGRHPRRHSAQTGAPSPPRNTR